MIRDLLSADVDSRLGCRPASSTRPAEGSPSSSPRGAALDSSAKTPAAVGISKEAAAGPGVVSSSAGGWKSVKEHAFFKDMNWEALLRGDVAAPIKPSGVGRGMVGNFAREYTRQRASWGGDQQELRDVADKEGLFKRELMGFGFVRD